MSQMEVKISPSLISGSVEAQASKSSMQRGIAGALLARGKSVLLNPSFSDDSLAALHMAECLGAKVSKMKDKVIIEGGLAPECSTLDCGESGLAVRMFSAIASLCEKEITLKGAGSIMDRPMSMIADALSSMGVEVSTTNGRLPLKIRGPIEGGNCYVDGSLSSQFLTGLLFALPLVSKDSVIRVDSLQSKPYIDLTIRVLSQFGIEIDNRAYEKILIKGKQEFRPVEYRVEEDWSGIAFLAVAGAIAGSVEVTKLSAGSVQADKKIIEILENCGADININDNTLEVKKQRLNPFIFDISDSPDLAPPLVALATFCDGNSVITGTRRLKSKESNRAKTLYQEFRKIGVDITISQNSMEIKGAKNVKGGRVNSHGDHRIAMALAVAATVADGPVIIEGAESINKSYPGFYDHMRILGAEVDEIKQ